MTKGEIAFDFGLFVEKGLHMRSGQTPVKAYNRMLGRFIAEGKARPSFPVSHETRAVTNAGIMHNLRDRRRFPEGTQTRVLRAARTVGRGMFGGGRRAVGRSH